MVKLYWQDYRDYAPTLFSEKLIEHHRLQINHETVRRWLMATGGSNVQRKKCPHRKRREWRAAIVELVQFDGSEHDWFEGRGPSCTVLHAIDDASNRTFLRFVPSEDTANALIYFIINPYPNHGKSFILLQYIHGGDLGLQKHDMSGNRQCIAWGNSLRATPSVRYPKFLLNLFKKYCTLIHPDISIGFYILTFLKSYNIQTMMNNAKGVNLSILVVSAVVICFEILSTRISSLIFVQNYAFIILSLAILGLGSGGIYSYYKIKPDEGSTKGSHIFSKFIFLSGISLVGFIVLEILFSITNPYMYFFLLFMPFFFAGIVYAEFFSTYAHAGFKIYASDLLGAAAGSGVSIFIFHVFTAANAVLFLALILFIVSITYLDVKKKNRTLLYLTLFGLAALLTVLGKREFAGNIPIGHVPGKDMYYAYDDPTIIESRWSINGRSDVVEYNGQNIIKYLFIDGAAGSKMFRFNGNIARHDTLLNDLLLLHSKTIPLLFLSKADKDNMLVIGPGGGGEILAGILGGVQKITGVEVNPDFVEIVKKYSDFNGGIYTNFPNVKIEVAEGRHFIKSTQQQYNIIVLALPSTKQLQNIHGLASNENFLLTVEAIKDYLNSLTQNGQLIFNLHNRYELVRLIVTALYAFKENGIDNSDALDHFIILGHDYAPTIVIRKSAYTVDEIQAMVKVAGSLPADLPRVTYFPFLNHPVNNEVENILLQEIKKGQLSTREIIARNSSDISPIYDDHPFFYKVDKGVPGDFVNLLLAISAVALLSVLVPLWKMRSRNKNGNEQGKVYLPLIVFMCIGVGFMILEIALFQKFILYLGSPTIALSLLLGSLLVGMGVGSYFGGKFCAQDVVKRLKRVSALIVITGVILFVVHSFILGELLVYGIVLRAIVCFILLSPLGFLLGIPFPTGIQMLKQNNYGKYIPWMYGVNGIFAVLGSVLGVILSMTFGFTSSFIVGLSMYVIIYLFLMSGARISRQN